LQKTASDLWNDLEEKLDADIELTRNGGFMVAETEEQVSELHIKHKYEANFGIPSELLTGDEARGFLPSLSDHLLGADWCPLDGYANPLLVTPAYIAAARREGAIVRGFSPVTAVRKTRSGFASYSLDDVWHSPYVVNVSGPWIGEIAALSGISLQMTPVAIQMHITTRADTDVLQHLVQHIGEGMSVKQVSAGNVLIGGGWPSQSFQSTGRSRIDEDSIFGNLLQAVRVLPFLRNLQLLRSWAGPLAATPDEMPVIGEVPGAPGYFVAGGTYSFTFAPLWATTLADLISHDVPLQPIDDLGPSRLMIKPAELLSNSI
jgi:sarcosine oxidase subunit beta